jgi:glycosyltransferase involved in cell wall biosynthesis
MTDEQSNISLEISEKVNDNNNDNDNNITSLSIDEILNILDVEPEQCEILKARIEKNQKICLAMIVKNETKVLKRCFDTLYPLIDYWVICDTGSTDGTQEFIKSYWEKKGISGELHQHEWKNFGHNRSLLMNAAKRKADYIITLDADEVFMFDNDFEMPNLDKDMYFIWTHKGNIKYQRLQLVSDKFDWYYNGVCHEYLTHIEKEGNTPETKDIMPKMHNIPYPDGSRSNDPNKYKRDAFLFEMALLDAPNNLRYVYYLAQSYRDSQDFDNAIKYYKKRVEMAAKCVSEETYYAQYQIGLCKILKGEPFENYAIDLLKACNIRPSRLEAAHIFIKEARLNGLSAVAFQQFKYLLEQPDLHTQDTSFLVSEIYDWSMLNELSLVAAMSGFYDDAFRIVARILKENKYPTGSKHMLEHNMNALYQLAQNKKNEKSNTINLQKVNI